MPRLRRTLMAYSALSFLLIFMACRAHGDWAISNSDNPVHVHFAKGNTELGTLAAGVQPFANNDYSLADFPEGVSGLTFTRRNWREPADVDLDIPAGTTVYLMLGSGSPANDVRQAVESAGWSKFGEAHFEQDNHASYLVVYKQSFDGATHLTVPGGGFAGDIVAASQIVLDKSSSDNPKPPEASPAVEESPNVIWRNEDSGTRPTAVARFQTSIKTLYVIEQDNGGMLGGASDLILTAEPGPKHGDIPVSFATPVGPQMHMVLDDVVRRLHLVYPAIDGTDKIEFSFEDKYDPHDGGSIGAACGTLLMSMIQGFSIDPDVAMTGDVSADGKVRAIGGVAAKLRGARAAGCTMVAMPTENIDQLIDTMIYAGRPALTDVQVIGISSLDEAAAVARIDRSDHLRQAIEIFRGIQQSAKESSDYLETPDAQQKLQRVLQLAPEHLSAKLLLDAITNRQRKRLSAAASEYYTFEAVGDMLPTLYAKEGNAPQSQDLVSDVSIDEGLKTLHKLRPMADLTVRPLIDAWTEFTEALEQSGAWNSTVEIKAQAVRDAMATLNANRDLAQKMLKQGI